MAGIQFKLELDEKDIVDQLGRALVKELNGVFLAITSDPGVRAQIGQAFANELRASPEYDSLVNGELKAIFGLTNPLDVMNGIIAAVTASASITYTPATFLAGQVRGSITVGILRDDFLDVLGVPGASYDSKGGNVPWLNWLLTAGDSVIIADYDVSFSPGFTDSRTGEAIMKRSSSGFRVPPEYSGTASDNWLTRTMDGMGDLIGNILFLELNRRL